MWLRNQEGHAAFDVRPLREVRQPGLSAMFRVRNEAAWIAPAIESVLGWCDEVVVALQPCDDETPAILEGFGAAIRVLPYPFELRPMGPGHDRCPEISVHATSYYYNWTLAHTSCTHVAKWDGDMVAMDWLGDELHPLLDAGHDRISFAGVDLVDDARAVGNHPHCPTAGVFRVTPAVRYRQGRFAETFTAPAPTHTIAGPAFVHLKWAKPEASAIQQWPADWRAMPHFQRIYQRRLPVGPYTGEYPTPLRRRLEAAA